MSEKEKVSLIVMEPGDGAVPPSARGVDEDFVPQSRPSVRAILGLAKPKEIDYDRLEKELNKAQSQMADLIASLEQKGPSGGFALDQISLSLAVSGEGSIGIATVGVEAGITLTYSKSG